jgi:hypothetical protein
MKDALELRMEKLRKKHELEKQNALQDFEAYRIRVIDTAQRTAREHQAKFELQADAIEKMNIVYQKTISAFESCNKELSNSIDDLKINEKSQLNELRKRFDGEKMEQNCASDNMMQKEQQEHLELLGNPVFHGSNASF